MFAQMAAAGGSTGLSLAGQSQANRVKDATTQYNLAAMGQRANAEEAAATARAEQERMRTARLISVQRAAAASSGGGVAGSALDVIGKTAARGSYNQDMRLWEGSEAARALSDKASMTQFAADQERRARPMEMASTVLKGVGAMAAAAKPSGNSSKLYYDDASLPDITDYNKRLQYE